MMTRSSLRPAIVFATSCILGAVFSPVFAGDLMSSQTAARLGLQEVWRKQMSVPAGRDSIVDQQIFVHQTNLREYVEVVGKAAEGQEAPVLFRIATDTPGPLGEPIGKAEAKRLAGHEVLRLKRRKKEPTITSRMTPRVHLYTLANNGTIDCRDAETGSPVWMTQVGKQRLMYGKMGIDDAFLTLTNGGNLIKIDITNGEPIESVVSKSVPLYGALNAGDYTIVPTIRNGVESYPLSDITDVPFMDIVEGIALVPPVKSADSSKIAWGTDRGFVYVMETLGTPSMMFRLATDGNVSGKIATAGGERFFFGSESGQAYCVKATRSGTVLWSRPYGEPFFKAPFVFENSVLFASAYGNLWALDQETGHPVWRQPIPNVDEIVGGLDGRIFVRLLTGSFAVLNAETGATIDVDRGFMPERLLVNHVTNRLYFVNQKGTVQCMRAIGADLPTLRQAVQSDVGSENAEAGTPAKDEPAKTTTDPFGAGGDDPFGAGDAGMSDDPFASGGDDPFATPMGDEDDPFAN